MAEITKYDALNKARAYVAGLKLPYSATYRRVMEDMWYPPGSDGVPTYRIPVILKRRDGTVMRLVLSVDRQTGELPVDPLERPTREQIETAMARAGQGYVRVVTRDMTSAKKLADKLFQRGDVVSVEHESRMEADAIPIDDNGTVFNALGVEWDTPHLTPHRPRNRKTFKQKPEEDERLRLLEPFVPEY